MQKKWDSQRSPIFFRNICRLLDFCAAFQTNGVSHLVGDFARTPILDRTRIAVAFGLRPDFAVLGEELERSGVEFDEGLLNHRLVFAVTTFHVHHHGDRNASGNPFVSTLGQVANRAHVTVHLVVGENRSGVAEAVAVVRIEIRRGGATTFIAKEVIEGAELALEALAALEFLLHHFNDELFGFNQGNLDVAVAVAFEHQLRLHKCRKAVQNFGRGLGNPLAEFFHLGCGIEAFDFGFVMGEGFGKFGNQHADIRNKFKKAFRNQSDTKILAVGGAGGDNVGELFYDMFQIHLFRLHFFGNEGDVRMGLQGGFQSDMGSGTSHKLDEVPVFLRRVGVAHDVADQFGVGLDSRIEAERGFDVFVFQVAVDGFRATANDALGILRLEIFTENGRIRVGVVAADDDDSVELLLVGDLQAFLPLFFGFQLGSSRLDDIESAGIAVGVHHLAVNNDELAVFESGRSAEETEKPAALVDALDAVEKARDNIVSTGSLTARKDNADIDRLGVSRRLARLEGNIRSTVGVREKGLDFFLVADGLGCLALVELDVESSFAKGYWKFRLVSLAGFAENGQIVGHDVPLG